MCRQLLSAVIVCGVMLCLGAKHSEPAQLDRLAWLTGSWATEKGGMRVEEHWTPARGGTMMGIGRVIQNERTVFFEFLRIEQTDDGIVYFAAPKGRHPATPFTLIELTADKMAFENPEHDFPNRITYWREGDDAIGAKIEGKNGEKAQSWIFKRVTNE